ncbi:hypothetical protein AVEN_211009-1 [Araneus ventricosus]|uniref:Uncharacterized protein n=1 Tax=Araneus ventricosus TaxID=182803 RepID=A0A4Y2QYB9_ARAVE|nr:hypothetical protein AVEN_153465-1 [Araneus ventricosus]GBN68376.1 hypothetical protein AVEN_211009-1 [Araneus ventricosus]
MKKKPVLKPHPKSQRMLYFLNHMTYGPKCKSVIFTYKKWNLEGPDSWEFYWHDLSKEPRCIFSRKQGEVIALRWFMQSFATMDKCICTLPEAAKHHNIILRHWRITCCHFLSL